MKTLQKYLYCIVVCGICIVAARVIYGNELGSRELTIIGIVGIINSIYGIWSGMQYEK